MTADRGVMADQPGSEQAEASPRPQDVAAIVVLILVGVLFLLHAAGRIGAPYGESDDGRNVGVWATGSRALRDVGPIDSRLGATHPDGTVYVSHPPLILWETAAIEAVAGESPWSTRAPAYLSLLAAIPLLYLVLRNLRVGPLPAAAAVAIGILNPMVFVYGAMLDTPMTSLAFGLGVVLVWQRALAGRPVPLAIAAGVAALAALSGWEATLLTVVAAGWLGLRSRRDVTLRHTALALGGGALCGVATTVVWGIWATGSVQVLLDQLTRRTSSDESATFLGSIDVQFSRVIYLFGPAVIGLIGCLVAVQRRMARPTVLLLLGTTVGYSLILFNGAYYHAYWNYWLLIPIVVGWGLALDDMATRFAPRSVPAQAIGIAALTVVFVALSFGKVTSPQQSIEDGTGIGRLLADAPFPADQTTLVEIGTNPDPSDWIGLVTGTTPRPLTDPAAFTAYAADHPDDLVLLNNRCPAPSEDDLCHRFFAPADLNTEPTIWRIVPAGELAATLRSGAT